jgi:hypothetical protein
VGVATPPCLIPALRKIAILGLKTKFYVLFAAKWHPLSIYHAYAVL